MGMKGIRIRQATISDVHVIMGLFRSNATDLSLVQLKERWIRSHVRHFFVVDSPKNGVVACGAISVLSQTEGELYSVSVDPDCHGRGYGRALVEGLLHEGRERGLSHLYLGTTKPTFFAKLGFRSLPMSLIGPGLLLRMGGSFFSKVPHVAWSLEMKKPGFRRYWPMVCDLQLIIEE